MALQSTYFLVAHGSRDPRPQVDLHKLAELVCERLAIRGQPVLSDLGYKSLSSKLTSYADPRPDRWPVVGSGTLELASTSLHEQIRQFGEYTRSLGLSQVELLPLFLLRGVHVMEDIPAEVAMAQKALGSEVRIEQLPHLGEHPALGQLLAKRKETVGADAWILLSHGSRRSGSNQAIEELAIQLGAVPAYWSVPPSLEARVEELVSRGHRQVGILPYFLFAGGITDAIALEVDGLAKQYPFVHFHLAEPLGPSAELADVIGELTNYQPKQHQRSEKMSG